jgi:hypothetical protein
MYGWQADFPVMASNSQVQWAKYCLIWCKQAIQIRILDDLPFPDLVAIYQGELLS